jgi:hypothetical protein
MAYGNNRKKLSDEEKVKLKVKLDEIQKSIVILKEGGIEPSQLIYQQEAKLQSQLNPNKYNAIKVEYNGVIYDSKREADFAKTLTKMEIPFRSQVKYVLQEGFNCHGEKVQPITYILDFLIHERFAVDVKGMITEVFRIKWKMFKNRYKDEIDVFEIPKNQTQMLQAISIITYKHKLIEADRNPNGEMF